MNKNCNFNSSEEMVKTGSDILKLTEDLVNVLQPSDSSDYA
jgi:hypothetical protein